MLVFHQETALYSIKEGDLLRVRLRNIEGNKVRLFVDLKRPLDFSWLTAYPDN